MAELAGGWTRSDLEAEVAQRSWFHTIDLGDGVLTPGVKDTLEEVGAMHIPADLRGRTVLDIGAYDGFYSFEAEARGADRVLATDKWTWTWEGSDARRNFELAREVRGSQVDDLEIAVEDLSPEALGGTFDVVLFLGVLYHAPDPLGYLQRVRRVTSGFAIVETVVDLLDVPVPALAYYPGASLNGDASNHFGPNPAAVEGLLLDAGFSSVEQFPPWQTEPAHAVRAPAAGGAPLTRRDRVIRRLRRVSRTNRSGRMVFHAHV